ncbi:DUF1990 family protein [Nocardia sp. NPDC059091]|uniref:DUF1990 family protein n=1 Tax=Nocardia sp. NPDC059091 TaxID=3346724 RepID=UPI0036CA42C8
MGLTYSEIGDTRPADPQWGEPPSGFRQYSRTVAIGHGREFWDRVSAEVLHWGVKRRSGFRVRPDTEAAEGMDYRISAGFGPMMVHEPVRVVQVVDLPNRRGFAYGTLHGHPVSGEEAFIVHLDPDGTVYLTLRSLTRAAPSGRWRAGFPILLLAQLFYRRRYLRVLAN